MQTVENPPYKGGWLEIGITRRREMNQNIPYHGLTLRWLILLSTPTEWGKEDVTNENLRHGWYWTSRSGYRQETEMGEATPSRCNMLNPKGECRTKSLGGTGEQDRLLVQTGGNSRDRAGLVSLHFPYYINFPRLSVAPGDTLPRRPSFLINSLHNNILLWFLKLHIG